MPDLIPDEFRRLGHQLVDWIASYLEHPEKYPVLSRAKPGELIDALPSSGPEKGEPLDLALADFEKLVLPAVTHWNHPGFLAYFATSASAPGILAELLIAALNTNGILWKTSPAVTELEIVVLSWLRQWMGLPDDNFGIIFDTASTSSLHAIAAAREMAAPEVHSTGRSHKPLVLYQSEHAHSSIEKAAIALGIGQQNVRTIPADAQFRMKTGALEHAIRRDLEAGRKPFCVVATVGTTSTTSIDPVREIAQCAGHRGLWLHVDTAYAGPAAIVPELRYILDGAEMADSLVLNPHKWMFTPVDCSVLYTRRPEFLKRALSLKPPVYLHGDDQQREVNLMEYAIPLGRRFRALKLWFIMRAFGREGIAAIIRDQCAMAREFAAWVEADDRFELLAPVPLSVVCFRRRGSDEANLELLNAINEQGDAYISHTVLNGRVVLRVAIGNIGTTRETLNKVGQALGLPHPSCLSDKLD
jgi:aromatic-L-amino-acid decarboxylase